MQPTFRLALLSALLLSSTGLHAEPAGSICASPAQPVREQGYVAINGIEELDIGESGLDKLVKACYRLLGLISFLTAGPKEVRAWTIERGTKAPQAAGKIHTDFERGFIRAEIVAYNDLIRCGTYAAAREQGLVRSEGKEYVMHDGDVTLFRFNV